MKPLPIDVRKGLRITVAIRATGTRRLAAAARVLRAACWVCRRLGVNTAFATQGGTEPGWRDRAGW